MSDEYVKAMTEWFARISRGIEGDVYAGSQPTEPCVIVGTNEVCPMCAGHGGSHGPEHGIPGGWSCETCRGTGILNEGTEYRFQKYQPYPDRHPNKGTTHERDGLKGAASTVDPNAWWLQPKYSWRQS